MYPGSQFMSGTYYTCLKSDRRNDSVNGSTGGHLFFCIVISSYFLRFEYKREYMNTHLGVINPIPGRRTYRKVINSMKYVIYDLFVSFLFFDIFSPLRFSSFGSILCSDRGISHILSLKT